MTTWFVQVRVEEIPVLETLADLCHQIFLMVVGQLSVSFHLVLTARVSDILEYILELTDIWIGLNDRLGIEVAKGIKALSSRVMDIEEGPMDTDEDRIIEGKIITAMAKIDFQTMLIIEIVVT